MPPSELGAVPGSLAIPRTSAGAPSSALVQKRSAVALKRNEEKPETNALHHSDADNLALRYVRRPPRHGIERPCSEAKSKSQQYSRIKTADSKSQDRSGQSEIRKSRQVVIGCALRKAAEHDVANAALSGAKLRGNGANRDARCPIGGKSIDAGRYGRKGNRCEAVRRRKIEGGAITGCEQLLLAGVAPAPDRADGVDDVLGE